MTEFARIFWRVGHYLAGELNPPCSQSAWCVCTDYHTGSCSERVPRFLVGEPILTADDLPEEGGALPAWIIARERG